MQKPSFSIENFGVFQQENYHFSKTNMMFQRTHLCKVKAISNQGRQLLPHIVMRMSCQNPAVTSVPVTELISGIADPTTNIQARCAEDQDYNRPPGAAAADCSRAPLDYRRAVVSSTPNGVYNRGVYSVARGYRVRAIGRAGVADDLDDGVRPADVGLIVRVRWEFDRNAWSPQIIIVKGRIFISC